MIIKVGNNDLENLCTFPLFFRETSLWTIIEHGHLACILERNVVIAQCTR